MKLPELPFFYKKKRVILTVRLENDKFKICEPTTIRRQHFLILEKTTLVHRLENNIWATCPKTDDLVLKTLDLFAIRCNFREFSMSRTQTRSKDRSP